MTDRTCAECGASLAGRRADAVCCSRRCGKIRWDRVNAAAVYQYNVKSWAAKKLARPPRACAGCGKDIPANRRYCTPRCRSAAAYQRHRPQMRLIRAAYYRSAAGQQSRARTRNSTHHREYMRTYLRIYHRRRRREQLRRTWGERCQA